MTRIGILRFLRWVVGLTITSGVIGGWLLAGRLGAALGLPVACIAAIVLWAVGYYFAVGAYLNAQIRHLKQLSADELCRIASDPLAPELGFAIGELQKRGVETRPSLGSLCGLIISPDGNQRGLGLSLLQGLYLDFFARLPLGISSADSPEVWRDRLAAVSSQMPQPGSHEGGST
jgi:hypothetical protein